MNQLPYSAADWAEIPAHERRRRRDDAWLRRASRWQGLAPQWRGVKVLGSGGYGQCGLFIYQGDNDGMPEVMVVKQSGRPDKSLQNESRLLKLCNETGSPHIVRLYRSYHEDAGTGTSAKFDPWSYVRRHRGGFGLNERRFVSRIYLEYCDRGDLSNWARSLWRLNRSVPEADLWGILQCLAKAAMVLELGHENDEMPSLNHAIGHFDIKPGNILIHRPDASHSEVGIFKMADFGLSKCLPETEEELRSPEWLNYISWRYTEGWGAPEQSYQNHPNRIISSPCNIWGIGALLYYLVTKGLSIPQAHTTVTIAGRAPFRTMGTPINHATFHASHFLKQTILTCLAYDPAERPTAQALVAACAGALAALSTPGGAPLPRTYTLARDLELLHEPDGNAEWDARGHRDSGVEAPEVGLGRGEPPRVDRSAHPPWMPFPETPFRPPEAESDGTVSGPWVSPTAENEPSGVRLDGDLADSEMEA